MSGSPAGRVSKAHLDPPPPSRIGRRNKREARTPISFWVGAVITAALLLWLIARAAAGTVIYADGFEQALSPPWSCSTATNRCIVDCELCLPPNTWHAYGFYTCVDPPILPCAKLINAAPPDWYPSQAEYNAGWKLAARSTQVSQLPIGYEIWGCAHDPLRPYCHGARLKLVSCGVGGQESCTDMTGPPWTLEYWCARYNALIRPVPPAEGWVSAYDATGICGGPVP